jgi:hypothetical protein
MSNLTNNRLSVVMTATQVQAVKDALQTILTNMPFLIGLTSEERMTLPKISVSNKVFTEDALNVVSNNTGLLPGYFSASGFQQDLELYRQLDELTTMAKGIVERMDDTQLLAGSEAYVSALTAYKLFGAAADAGIPGADTLYDQLKERFSQYGNPAPKAPEQPTV